jgi:hypothetical protein
MEFAFNRRLRADDSSEGFLQEEFFYYELPPPGPERGRPGDLFPRLGSVGMLNDYQRRGLSITLRIVEESLEHIEQTLKNDGYSGVLYEIRYDITKEIRKEISNRIPLAIAEIEKITETFHLEKQIGWASNEAYGKLPYCWEILENARAKRLKRYGDISMGLVQELDPHLDAIIKILGEMERILFTVRKL